MTIVAGIAACDVGRMLAGGSDAVVAGTTIADYLGVIDSNRRYPYRRAVTIFADVRRLYVCRALAGRLRAVMAADAVSEDIHVREIRR